MSAAWDIALGAEAALAQRQSAQWARHRALFASRVEMAQVAREARRQSLRAELSRHVGRSLHSMAGIVPECVLLSMLDEYAEKD